MLCLSFIRESFKRFLSEEGSFSLSFDLVKNIIAFTMMLIMYAAHEKMRAKGLNFA